MGLEYIIAFMATPLAYQVLVTDINACPHNIWVICSSSNRRCKSSSSHYSASVLQRFSMSTSLR